jgi:predicted transcriptional regulator
MDEILTIRVPKGMRRLLEKRARARRQTLSQYVRSALEAESFLDSFEAARAAIRPEARKRGIYTDEDAFEFVRESRSRR